MLPLKHQRHLLVTIVPSSDPHELGVALPLTKCQCVLPFLSIDFRKKLVLFSLFVEYFPFLKFNLFVQKKINRERREGNTRSWLSGRVKCLGSFSYLTQTEEESKMKAYSTHKL